tara:strand:+ start:940 stop:1425 length:486 start_codon:yes stop_codon:yes gene_type:complete
MYDFSETTLESYWIEKYGSVVKAVIKKQNKLISDTVEELYAFYTNGIVRNAIGFDVERPNKILDELKYTGTVQGKSALRVGGLTNKEGKSDNIVIIDGVNNRTFRIPNHIFFNFAHLTISKTKTSTTTEFHWSVSYNKNDKVKRENTELLLQYEVTNEIFS